MLQNEEKNDSAEFCVKEVQYIQAEVGQIAHIFLNTILHQVYEHILKKSDGFFRCILLIDNTIRAITLMIYFLLTFVYK